MYSDEDPEIPWKKEHEANIKLLEIERALVEAEKEIERLKRLLKLATVGDGDYSA